jgi:hypothetical protein
MPDLLGVSVGYGYKFDDVWSAYVDGFYERQKMNGYWDNNYGVMGGIRARW